MPFSGDLMDPGIKFRSLALQEDSLPFDSPGEVLFHSGGCYILAKR